MAKLVQRINQSVQNKIEYLCNHRGQIAASSLIFLIIIAITYVLWNLDAQTRASIIAFIGTFSVGIYTLNKQKQKDLDLKMREQKLPAYEKTLNLFKSIITAVHEKSDFDEREILRQNREINYAIIIGGSPSVVAKWHEYYEWISTQPDDVDEFGNAIRIWTMRMKIAQVAREIRKDLGHNDTELSDDAIADLLMPLQKDARNEILAKVGGFVRN